MAQPDIAALIADAVATALTQAEAKPAKRTGKAGKPKAGKSSRKAAPWYDGITFGLTKYDCWLALGGDSQYEPKRDPEAPATPSQLNALNLSGKLTVTGI